MEDCTNNRQTHFRAIRQRSQLSPSPICTTKEERKYTNTQKYKIRNYAYTKYRFQILGNKAILKIITLANLHHQDGKEIHKHTLKKNKINKDIHTQVQNTEPHFYLSDTFIEYLCNLIDYCTTKWRRQYYCTIYNKMRQRCLLAWIV
jgi:hypothetical protein